MNIDFPFHFDNRGRVATTGNEDHIRDMIELLLFTNPGERVNRPTFGSGLMQLVFAPNSDGLAAGYGLERGDVSAFEYLDGHTFPPGREIQPQRPRRRVHPFPRH